MGAQQQVCTLEQVEWNLLKDGGKQNKKQTKKCSMADLMQNFPREKHQSTEKAVGKKRVSSGSLKGENMGPPWWSSG